jgi:hypothetical protein
MKYRVGFLALFACSFAFSLPAQSAKLPQLRTSPRNAVPACVTPGRLKAYLKARNPKLTRRFNAVPGYYRDHGNALGLRWDYAFFQMILETNALSFRRGNGRRGDVSAKQNNFAGLGATGGGVPGERFRTVSDGVLAHLQHLTLYSGNTVDNPIAERTRKVQNWGIIHPWARRLGRPATFRDLAGKWAPGSRGYRRNLKAIAAYFFDKFCNIPDPDGGIEGEPVVQAKLPAAGKARPATRDAGVRSGLGAGSLAKSPPAKAKLMVQQASLTPSIARSPVPPSTDKCRIWTASYGGKKSILIKSVAADTTNYTVLDVHVGAEMREARAFIDAYARGGALVGKFADQTKALERAFGLCPDG